MKLKYVAIAAITSSIILSACDININTGGGDDSNKSNSESKHNDNQKSNDQQSNDNQSTSNNSQSSNQENSSQNNQQQATAQNHNDAYVTRDNVIDIVESYEGGYLDTDKYTYKEPEKRDNGEWGFSYTDKDGNLAGSYIIDKDGYVTKYDENGDVE